MSITVTLRGIAWDHPRGYEPLKATSISFSRLHPDVQIVWDIRSLKEFGDMPIEDLIHTYDLITIDHPYMGQAHSNRLLLTLEKNLSSEVLETLSIQSVGPSFHSYFFNSHLYALPIDAAALVAASRNDLITKLGLTLPTTRLEVFDFYRKMPNSYAVAWPLCPTDLWCTFLTLCAQDAGRHFINNHAFDEEVGNGTIDELKQHLECLHPESINWNPIQVLDYMSEKDEIVYAPFLFGYSNYARKNYMKNLVTFSNSPTNPKTDVSTILGGVGLAISSKCKHVDLAINYVKFVAHAETQKSLYTQSGGQPGNIIAWQSTINNALCNNFFSDTLETMQNAFIRPQHAGWNQFQEQGADLLHNGLVKDISSDIIMKSLNQLYQSTAVYEKRV